MDFSGFFTKNSPIITPSDWLENWQILTAKLQKTIELKTVWINFDFSLEIKTFLMVFIAKFSLNSASIQFNHD